MDFSAEQNAYVPVSFAFEKATDHAFFTALARDHGVRMEPLVPFVHLHTDCGWRVAGPIRGRKVDCEITIDDFKPPEAFALNTLYRGVDFLLAVEFEELDADQCRIYADLSAEAMTLTARLAMKAASLTNIRLERRFRRSVRRAAQWLEAEYQTQSGAR